MGTDKVLLSGVLGHRHPSSIRSARLQVSAPTSSTPPHCTDARLLSFVKKHTIDMDCLSHIKKIRRPRSAPPGSPSNAVSTTANTICSVMLFPTSAAPDNLAELLADSPLAFMSPVPFKVQVPACIARTEEQCREWSKLWPVNMVLLRVGPNATIRHAGWARAKHEWVTKEGEKVWLAALEAQKRGEVSPSLSYMDP